jgi:hypothetical protein
VPELSAERRQQSSHDESKIVARVNAMLLLATFVRAPTQNAEVTNVAMLWRDPGFLPF